MNFFRRKQVNKQSAEQQVKQQEPKMCVSCRENEATSYLMVPMTGTFHVCRDCMFAKSYPGS